MDESQEQDFDKSKSGEVGSEWDESVKDDETEEPVINVELDDQGNLKEEE